VSIFTRSSRLSPFRENSSPSIKLPALPIRARVVAATVSFEKELYDSAGTLLAKVEQTNFYGGMAAVAASELPYGRGIRFRTLRRMRSTKSRPRARSLSSTA